MHIADINIYFLYLYCFVKLLTTDYLLSIIVNLFIENKETHHVYRSKFFTCGYNNIAVIYYHMHILYSLICCFIWVTQYVISYYIYLAVYVYSGYSINLLFSVVFSCMYDILYFIC